MKDLAHQDVEEVRVDDSSRLDDSYRSMFDNERPSWWGLEQERATLSRILCICGHEENEHCVPKDDYPRECLPRRAVWDVDIVTGEDFIDDGGCACMEFQAARPPALAFPP